MLFSREYLRNVRYTPDSYDLVYCYVRVFSVLFKSEHIVCAGFHLSIKNVGISTVDIHNFAEKMLHYKRLHSLYLVYFMYQISILLNPDQSHLGYEF
ncbi:predicted protein [Methanosarcina acetivorans C2A]|uniref:Uncharacterized protein n=1 Tax=Methanosarcina acetivorans (strain ATCC 35395 / DSM 2834 / JCM 12185 / C2A) TaxID=188937 RepID=Q8TJ05_METAC|nr:predicted protein [Methanosarcina acetivorans C2A]